MDIKQLKILELLKESGVGIPVDISPLLLTMFPNVSRTDSFEIRWAASIIHKILEDMKVNGLIDVSPYISLGSGNETNGYTWLDVVHINASLKSKGIDRLEEELKKTDNEKLTDSIIESNQSNVETNKSVQEVNAATKILYEEILPNNFTAQKSASNWSIGLAALSVIFIGISAYLQYQDKTSQRVRELKQEVQETSKALKDMKLSLEKINLSTKRPNTIFVKVKK